MWINALEFLIYDKYYGSVSYYYVTGFHVLTFWKAVIIYSYVVDIIIHAMSKNVLYLLYIVEKCVGVSTSWVYLGRVGYECKCLGFVA